MTEIEQKVKEIIVDKLGVDEAKVTMDANFISDLNADSLDTVDLIMEFDSSFESCVLISLFNIIPYSSTQLSCTSSLSLLGFPFTLTTLT